MRCRVGFLGLIFVAVGFGAAMSPSPSRPKVVLFVLDGLSYRQAFPQGGKAFGQMGAWLAQKGSVAVLNTMGYGGADRFRAAMTLACGVRAFGDEGAAQVLQAGEPMEADNALAAFRRRVGDAPLPDAPPPFQPLVFPMLAELKGRNEHMQKKLLPFGVVAQSLRQKNLRLLAIGCGDPVPTVGFPSFPPERFRHGLLMALDEKGVGAGLTGTGLLRRDATMPFGIAVDEGRWREAVAAAWRRADVLVLFPGETLRADLYGSDRLIPLALHRELALLRPVAERLNLRRDLLLVFSLAPSHRGRYEHSFLCAVGKGMVSGGLLTSATTHQVGVASILDIPATVLHSFGVEPAHPINGAPLRSVPSGDDPFRRLWGVGEAARITDSWWRVTALAVWCIGQALVFAALALTALWGRGAKRTERLVAASLGLLAWLPPAVHLGSSGFNEWLQGHWVRGYGQMGVGVVSGLVAVPLSWWSPQVALKGALIWTSLVMVNDGLTAGSLSLNTPFGYSTFFGGRYYGLGNVGMGLTLGALVALAWALRWRRAMAAVIGALGAVLVGAPFWGANVGGALTGAALTATIIGAERWRWWHLFLALLVTAAVLSGFAGWELTRPEPLTHWGRFVHSVAREGVGALSAMVWTKLGITLRAFQAAHWDLAWAAQGGVLAVLWWWGERDWRFWTVVVGSLAACALNDSGPQTPVAFAFFPLSVMALQALAGRADRSAAVVR